MNNISERTETMQYLTFKLDDEIFTVDVSRVREILELKTIIKIPKTPDFMIGVINLRGSVVPVVDMRLKFGMEKTENTIDTCIIVMEILLGAERTVLGALADSVQEVIELEPGQIEPAPKIGTNLKTEFIKGIGKKDALFIIILDIDRVFTTDELSLVQAAGKEVHQEENQVKA